ncbi:MAG: translocation/assembly module TamB domain-containing protein [Gemmatimonadota bacterium]
MPRWLLRFVFVVLLGAVAAVVGTVTALVGSKPGRTLLARFLSTESNRLVRGSVEIGRISGGFLSGLDLDSVVVRDTSGVLLASIKRLELRYGIGKFIAGQYVLDSARIIEADIHLIKHRKGRMNYEEILRLGEGPGGGPSPLIELRNLLIDRATFEITTPWDPDGRLTTAAQADSALAAERAKPGHRIEAGVEGLAKIRTITNLTLRVPVIQVSSPDHRPLSARIDSLMADVSDPAVAVRDLKASIVQGGDSLLIELDRAVLPHTVARGTGRMDWPQDTVLYNFAIDLSQLDLVDIRFISPQFPAMRGRGKVLITALGGDQTEFDVRNLRLADTVSTIDGDLVAVTDVDRGLGFKKLGLNLNRLNLDVARAYIDSLPFYGWITGPLSARGFFDGMTVNFDWRFEDARVPAPNQSRLALDGLIVIGAPNGLFFKDTKVPDADLDLRTVRLVAPSVTLDGRLALQGALTGPLKDVTYVGTVMHQDGDRPASRLSGTARLNTGAPVFAVDADLVIDTLSFEGIRRSFPSLTAQGSLAGRIKLNGDLERLAVDADLSGEIGRYVVRGMTTLRPPRWATDQLHIDFTAADLALLRGTGPTTSLNGDLTVTATIDTLVAPTADLAIHLTPSRIRQLPIDSAVGVLRIHDSIITVDTLSAQWKDGRLDGTGSLGWTNPKQGTLTLAVLNANLAPFDSLVRVLGKLGPADTASLDRLQGRASVRATIAGSLDRLTVALDATADSVRWRGYEVGPFKSTISYRTGDTATVSLEATATEFRTRGLAFTNVHVLADGSRNDLHWHAGWNGMRLSDFDAGGRYTRHGNEQRIRVDSLSVQMLDRTWTLARPAEFAIADAGIAVDTVQLSTRDGSGSVELAGSLPGDREGHLTISAFGLGLRDVYALFQLDTVGVGGLISFDTRITGTAKAPLFRGSGSITAPVIGDFRAPLIRAVFNYESQKLQSNVTFWRTGRPVLDVTAELPLDLAFGAVAKRQLPLPLMIEAKSDSVDLAVVEALTPNVRRVRGALAIDAKVDGTWEKPRLGGFLRVSDGYLDVPSLGVRYGPIKGALRFLGDSIRPDSLTIGSGPGVLAINGGMRIERLSHPLLGLELIAQDFLVMDVADFLTLQTTGQVKLTGTLEHPVLTGQAVASNSVVYFADLISKNIVNLDDPLNADLVDSTLIRTQNLGAAFQSRFLDSLTIQSLALQVGQGVWLRSNEANIQLEGQVTVSKQPHRSRGKEYLISGELNTPRGTYTLKIGPVTRSFTVEQGRLRYFGTSDLNAELDISARYLVRTEAGSGEDLPIIARLTGTLLVPKLTLSSAPGHVPLSQRDLVSLLLTGRTSSVLPEIGAATNILLGAFSSELERALIGQNRGVDLIEIRPGFAGSGFTTGVMPTQLAIGRQLGQRWFVTATATACIGGAAQSSLGLQNLGATLEYRLNRDFKLQVVAEPIQGCATRAVSALTVSNRYQFGADLRWDRSY